jgi:hypothetical protein
VKLVELWDWLDRKDTDLPPNRNAKTLLRNIGTAKITKTTSILSASFSSTKRGHRPT